MTLSPSRLAWSGRVSKVCQSAPVAKNFRAEADFSAQDFECSCADPRGGEATGASGYPALKDDA